MIDKIKKVLIRLENRKKKKEMQKKLDSILKSDKSNLEMANETQILFKSDCGTFQELNTDEIIASPLGDYILSPQWDRERSGCWQEKTCESGKKAECSGCPKMEMMEGYRTLTKDHLEFANQAIEVFNWNSDSYRWKSSKTETEKE